MIKRLRIKFVCINMTIVTIMLCVIFGLVLHFTSVSMEKESIEMMQSVALDPLQLGTPGKGASGVRLPYFALQLGPGGELLASGGGYYDLTDRALLNELISLSSVQKTGVLSDYGLRYVRVVTPTMQCIVFADMSSEINTINNLLQNCLLIGAASFIIFLMISILLARWAVKPVAVAWEQQRQFVSNASHELKTPLTVILSNAQMLAENVEDPELRKRMTASILTVSQQMKDLVTKLLNSAQVDQGIGAMQFSAVDLSHTVTNALLPFAVLKHELRTYFRSLTAYVFGAFLLLFIGIGSVLYNLQAAVSNFEFVLGFSCLVFVVIVPILTMRVIAEERKQKTDQLLYSLPITTTQVVLGKYLALLVVYLIPLAIISLYPLIFSQYGDVYLLTAYGSILAFFILGAALIALGVFISSLTENQGFAAGIGIAVILLNYYSVSLSQSVSSTAFGSLVALAALIVALGFIIKHLTKNNPMVWTICIALYAAMLIAYWVDHTKFGGLLPIIMTTLSLFERFYVFVNGVFDVTGIVYYLTVIVFFLFLSVQSLEKRRYN